MCSPETELRQSFFPVPDGWACEIAAQYAAKADPAMTALKKGMYPHTLEALAQRNM